MKSGVLFLQIFNKMKMCFFSAWLLIGTVTAISSDRIVTVGGAVTETVFALGAGDLIVGVDTSSLYPESSLQLPKVGYQRTLSAEGIASLNPSLVIASSQAGPPQALTQLQGLGISVVQLEEGFTMEAVKARVRKIASILHRDADALVANIDHSLATLPRLASNPRVLFVMSPAGGAPLVAGSDTAADAMMRLAGALNVVDSFSGYKQLSPEALVSLNPEVVLTTSRSMQSKEKIGELLSGLEFTKAGQNSRLIVMDDLFLLGFGPRTGDALRELIKRLNDLHLEGKP